MAKYIYISDFLSKRLKNDTNIYIAKNHFIKIDDQNNKKILQKEIDNTLNNLPNLKFKDEELNKIIQENKNNEEIINIFSKEILKKDLSQFLKNKDSIEELIVFSIALTLEEIYEENQEDLIVNDISGFEPIYQKKRCDLIITNAFLKKYLIIIKRTILFEELSFIKEFETKTDKLTKSDLNKAKSSYDSIIRLIEEFRISLESLNLDFPEMRTKFIREHKLTEKSKPIIELSKKVENNNQKIIDELNNIANNARKRKEFMLKELNENHISWKQIKKKFIEQKILKLN